MSSATGVDECFWQSLGIVFVGGETMGYAVMLGFCAACRRPISFNPHKVPSLRINGVKEPICESCANRWNELHPEAARPIMAGAYEVMAEEEL
jgi:hypothetical protein